MFDAVSAGDVSKVDLIAVTYLGLGIVAIGTKNAKARLVTGLGQVSNGTAGFIVALP